MSAAPDPLRRGSRGDDDVRSFTYFTPGGRRATRYEDATCDTQVSVHRHMTRGWPTSFADGRGTWWDHSTQLRSADWFAWRDPSEWWERTYYQQGAQVERAIDAAVATARAQGLFAHFTPEWIAFLRTNLQVPAFVEHGLWIVAATTHREALSDALNHAIGLESGTKLRAAQALVLYGMDLEEEFGDFAIDRSKTAFVREEHWQRTRRFLERLRTRDDWAEMIVATKLVFEPLVGVLIRRELFIRSAGACGDTVTPAVFYGAEQEWGWARGWAASLARFVGADAEHGEANRAILAEWIADWVPQAREAARGLEALFAHAPGAPPFADSLAAVEADLSALHEEAGLTAQVPA